MQGEIQQLSSRLATVQEEKRGIEKEASQAQASAVLRLQCTQYGIRLFELKLRLSRD